MVIPTPDDIKSLSLTNHAVQRCIQLWLEGYCTWEQALMMSVIALANINDELNKSAIKVIETRDCLPYG